MAKTKPRSTRGLVEIGSVTTIGHDYTMQLVGVENDERGNAYHLALQPTHDPWHYRLRDVWIDTNDFSVHKLVSAGNFTGGLATKARWLEETLEPVSARGLLGIGSQTWSGWRITFDAIAASSVPIYLNSPFGDALLTEPD